MIATQPSDVSDDIQLVALLNADNAQVGVGKIDGITISLGSGGADGDHASTVGKIYNKTTPQAMVDKEQYRIPPRQSTLVWVQIDQGVLGKDKVLYLTVLDQSATNGKTEVQELNQNWMQEIDLKIGNFKQPENGKPYVFEYVRGSSDQNGANQTAPGSAGKLFLAVVNKSGITESSQVNTGGPSAVLSAGFSVSAIPIAIAMQKLKAAAQAFDGFSRDPKAKVYAIVWGAQYQVVTTSDSGNPKDLNRIGIAEAVSNQIQGAVNANRSFRTPNEADHIDTNAINGPARFIPKVEDTPNGPTPITAAQAAAIATKAMREAMLANKASLPDNVPDAYQFYEFIDPRSSKQTLDDQKKAPYDVAASGFLTGGIMTKDDQAEVDAKVQMGLVTGN